MLTFDPTKRSDCLAARGLDFAAASHVFSDPDCVTAADLRVAYGEERYISAGQLNGRMVVVVWTPRGTDRHIISIRHCHAKEIRAIKARQGRFKDPLDRS